MPGPEVDSSIGLGSELSMGVVVRCRSDEEVVVMETGRACVMCDSEAGLDAAFAAVVGKGGQ